MMNRFRSVDRWLWLVALVILTRAAFLMLFGHTLTLDTSGYDAYAVNLISGHGYTRFADLHPDSDLPPLYSFFLAAVYSIAGRSALNVAVAQIFLEIGTVLLVSGLGTLIAGENVGFLAGVLTALYPYQLFQDLTVNDTAIFLFLLSAALYCAARAASRPDWDRSQMLSWIGCGLAIGVGALTKTWILVIIPLLILGAWRRAGFITAFRAAVLVGGVALIAIAPWSIRNTKLNSSFTLTSTNDGSNFYQANNACAIPYMESGWDVQWITAPCMMPVPAGLTDLQADHWMMQQGIMWLVNNPTLWPRLLIDKFLVLWSPDITPTGLPPSLQLSSNDPVTQYNTPVFEAARLLHLLYFTPLLILAVMGLVIAMRRRIVIAPIVSGMVAITIAYLIFHPSTRYRSPVDPFLFILSSYAILTLWEMIQKRRQSSTMVNAES